MAQLKGLLNSFIMFFVVGVMIIPLLSTLAPLYSFINHIDSLNTYWNIICIMVTGQLPLAIPDVIANSRKGVFINSIQIKPSE